MPGRSVHVPGDVFADLSAAELLWAVDVLESRAAQLRDMLCFNEGQLARCHGMAAGMEKTAEALKKVIELTGR